MTSSGPDLTQNSFFFEKEYLQEFVVNVAMWNVSKDHFILLKHCQLTSSFPGSWPTILRTQLIIGGILIKHCSETAKQAITMLGFWPTTLGIFFRLWNCECRDINELMFILQTSLPYSNLQWLHYMDRSDSLTSHIWADLSRDGDMSSATCLCSKVQGLNYSGLYLSYLSNLSYLYFELNFVQWLRLYVSVQGCWTMQWYSLRFKCSCDASRMSQNKAVALSISQPSL